MTTEPATEAAARTDETPTWRRRVFQVMRWVGAFVALCLGWFLAQWIFSWAGHPPALVQFLIAVALVIVLSWIIGTVIARLTGRTPEDPRRVAHEVVEALERISRGDFNVRVNAKQNEPMMGLAQSVNQMAQQLGDLEQQRQDFISNVSHEIQSPLTSISGFAALLRQGGLDDATRDHYLDVISSEAKRVSSLGDNLLRLSALEESADPARTRYRLDEQLRSVILTLEPQWSAKNLDVGLDTDELFVEADQDMLRQVWTNLLQNAIKYTPAGGRILVRASYDGSGIRCEVSDSGIGISAADLPHVFERFFRADRSRTGAGNGLGLSLARRIVELHGGTLTVASELGTGSTFTVSLPAREP